MSHHGTLYDRWWSGEECYSWVDLELRERGFRPTLLPGHVGDLLEAGDWRMTRPAHCNRGGTTALPLDDPHQVQWRFREESRVALGFSPFGQCGYFHTLRQLGGVRIGRCMLATAHPRWEGPVGVEMPNGERHNVYLFSARDSAQMLSGMRRRLTEPMEEL